MASTVFLDSIMGSVCSGCNPCAVSDDGGHDTRPARV